MFDSYHGSENGCASREYTYVYIYTYIFDLYPICLYVYIYVWFVSRKWIWACVCETWADACMRCVGSVCIRINSLSEVTIVPVSLWEQVCLFVEPWAQALACWKYVFRAFFLSCIYACIIYIYSNYANASRHSPQWSGYFVEKNVFVRGAPRLHKSFWQVGNTSYSLSQAFIYILIHIYIYHECAYTSIPSAECFVRGKECVCSWNTELRFLQVGYIHLQINVYRKYVRD